MVAIPPGLRDMLLEENARSLIEDSESEGIINFGTNNNDVISGSSIADIIFGLLGNDRIVSNGGADIVFGDEGNDTIVGGGGRDTLVGGADNDRVDGGSGNDVLVGESGNDQLIGRSGNDEFDGGTGDDLLRGGRGFDTAHFAGDLVNADGSARFDVNVNSSGTGTIEDLFGQEGFDRLFSIEQLKFDDREIFIDGRNNGPDAVDDVATTQAGTDVTIDVLANDFDVDTTVLGRDDSLTVTAVNTSGTAGDVTINPDGSDVEYDPGTAFDALFITEQGTDEFSYTIEDEAGATSTAGVTVSVAGTQAIIVENTRSLTSLNSGTEYTTTLRVEDTALDGLADIDVLFSLGIGLTGPINIAFVVDVSGSTSVSAGFGGLTILEAEVDALQNLVSRISDIGLPEGNVTISIIPFSGIVGGVQTFVLDSTDDAGSSDIDDINAALDALSSGGTTNFVAALEATSSTFDALETANGNGTNIVYFLSDGEDSNTDDEIIDAATPLQGDAQIATFALGNAPLLSQLDLIDNTGGTDEVDNIADLDTALLDGFVPDGDLVSADIFIFDNTSGDPVLVNEITLDASEFNATPLGLEISLDSVAGFADMFGDEISVELELAIDDNGDGIADDTFTLTAGVELFDL